MLSAVEARLRRGADASWLGRWWIRSGLLAGKAGRDLVALPTGATSTTVFQGYFTRALGG